MDAACPPDLFSADGGRERAGRDRSFAKIILDNRQMGMTLYHTKERRWYYERGKSGDNH
jgi:hypothetical protein